MKGLLTKTIEYGVRIAFFVAAATFAYSVWRQPTLVRYQPPRFDVQQLAEPIALEHADLRTPLEVGTLRILEFGDFECPFCARHANDTLPRLRAELLDSGISYEFRQFPLETIHPNSSLAARAAECARAQEKFWPAHGALTTLGASLTPSKIHEAVEAIVPNKASFQECLDGEWVDTSLASDRRVGRRLGVVSTPTFVILRGTPRAPIAVAAVVGAVPLEAFHEAIAIGQRASVMTSSSK